MHLSFRQWGDIGVTMTNQFDLTEDQRAIQDMARKFTADNITPDRESVV